jgi:hypothetical protein
MELIERILVECGYTLIEKGDSVSFFAKEGQDYYILGRYSAEDMSDFQNGEVTSAANAMISKYKSTYSDLSKNTSLFVSIEVDNYESFIKDNKNSIYFIEEDPYVFRKYVILHTPSSLADLLAKKTSDIITYAQSSSDFNSYEKNASRYENSAYFLALQLLIKLPFLDLSKESTELKGIESRLSTNLNEQQKYLANEVADQTLEGLSDTYDDVISLDSNTRFDEWLEEVSTKLEEVR